MDKRLQVLILQEKKMKETCALLPIKLVINGETTVLLVDYKTALAFKNGTLGEQKSIVEEFKKVA